MKYVRTKDGIFEKANQTIYKNEKIEYLDGLELVRIIDQADTIEELCDEIVVVKENEKPIINTDFGWKLYQKHIERVRKHRATIYGAIWTDKGLIYVAKMNEKGELELL